MVLNGVTKEPNCFQKDCRNTLCMWHRTYLQILLSVSMGRVLVLWTSRVDRKGRSGRTRGIVPLLYVGTARFSQAYQENAAAALSCTVGIWDKPWLNAQSHWFGWLNSTFKIKRCTELRAVSPSAVLWKFNKWQCTLYFSLECHALRFFKIGNYISVFITAPCSN